MTKLYKAGLAVLAIALLTSSALAFSPVWAPVPDVNVGGLEGGGVVFTDAYDVFDFVTDEDNDTTSLGIWFAEGPWDTLESRSNQVTDGAATNDLSINALGEVDYSGGGNTSLADQSLLLPAEQLVSSSDGNLTYATSDGADRAVVLIASDGFTEPAVSALFRVVGDAASNDFLTFPVSVIPIDEWDLQTDFNADWAFGSFGGTAVTSGQSGDALQMTSAAASADGVAVWQLSGTATKIPANAGDLIRGTFTLSSTAAVDAWPAVQARIFESSAVALNTRTNVSSNQYVPDPGVSRDYPVFYQPVAGLPSSEANVAMFLIDTSPTQGGTFSLEKLVVDRIDGLDGLFTDAQVIDSGESIDFTSVLELITNPANVTSAGTADSYSFTASSMTDAGNIGIAQINNVLTMAANTLYRVVYTASSSQAQTLQPGFRFRIFDTSTIGAINKTQVYEVLGQAAVSPTFRPDASGKDYTVYYDSDGVDGNELRVAFDLINNDATKSGTITWDRAVVQSVDIGVIP